MDQVALQKELHGLKAARTALGAERQALEKELAATELGNRGELLKLKMRLGEVLGRLSSEALRAKSPPKAVVPGPEELPMPQPQPKLKSEEKPAAPAGEMKKTEPKKEIANPPPGDPPPASPADLADSLFRQGEFARALEVYRSLDNAGLAASDRLRIHYMTATCHRKLGQADQARSLYRTIANNPDDEILAQCAQWQLSAMSWQDNVSGQMEQLQKRIQALEKTP
jgi:hypothetical protein